MRVAHLAELRPESNFIDPCQWAHPIRILCICPIAALRGLQEAIMSDETDARIRERAHAIWEAQGHPEGLADDHWRQAAAEVAQARTVAELPHPLATGAAAEIMTKIAEEQSQG
ncbi:DUF2934 domain-containing protein [Sphingobium sp. CR2-8]|uniref:DUF2934 domain-containing protein n=1 Tax=Sphingobium sp. CR2-8 TaxID=1306534 RepID=UPI002DBE0505|nr:DUF2934 domain-containing protein [Sphingobium sp. CR2-8]MEC3909198.1 DUF2934 domain-containing protein [Sphingobium sp. CR2-8]